MEKLKARFGLAIRELRIKYGITLLDFCQYLNIDCSYWSRVEQGLAYPPTDINIYIKMIELLKLDLFKISMLGPYLIEDLKEPVPEISKSKFVAGNLPAFVPIGADPQKFIILVEQEYDNIMRNLRIDFGNNQRNLSHVREEIINECKCL